MGTLVSTEADEEEMRVSRRRLLKSALLLSAFGGGIVILGGAAKLVAEAAPPSKTALQTPTPSGLGGASTPSSNSAPQALPASAPNVVAGASLKVKVMYFQMPQNVTSTKEEYFVLTSPAYFRDLLNEVIEEHPLLSPMIPSMMILVNGVLAVPGTPLADGDEVDLIPAIAGG